jgi:hypothetical protein
MRATGDAEAAADLTAETFAAALAGRKRKGRVNWIDAGGNEGSRGQELLPP